MCILCNFLESWQKQYNASRYPIAFYNHFLRRIQMSYDYNDMFASLLQLLRWKLGLIKMGKVNNSEILAINGCSFACLDNEQTENFKKKANDVDFLKNCFKFRDDLIDGYTFFNYLKDEKKIFGKGFVLYIFLMHSLKPDRYVIIDQHVWRAMKVLQGCLESLSEQPRNWSDYEEYAKFVDNFYRSLCNNGKSAFNWQTIDRSLMSFGKWIKNSTINVKSLMQVKTGGVPRKKGDPAGNCPRCGSQLVWRKARRTGEWYRGCTNFKGGCRWNDRSY